MIIKEIRKEKEDYIINIDDIDYLVDENTIVKYNLYANKEINNLLLEDIINSYQYEKYYNMALRYSLKYNKSKKGLYLYLINKEIPSNLSYKICDDLEEKKIINDYVLAENYTLSYVNKSYGKYMIIKKLNDLFISKDAIEKAINELDYDNYYSSMNKYVKKNESKYLKYNENIRKYKIHDDLVKRGYTSDDISNLKIE